MDNHSDFSNMNPKRQLTKAYSVGILKKLGLKPSVFIDVGIHKTGELDIYLLFPEAKLLLIEPNKDYKPEIQNICSKFKNAEIIWAAASNKKGIYNLVPMESLSLLKNKESSSFSKCANHPSRTVPMTTIDALCEERQLQGPFMIKVDVDGDELEIIEGASKTLNNTNCVILESCICDILPKTKGLEKHGFFLWDIAELCYFNNMLHQVDLIFIKEATYNDPNFSPWAHPQPGQVDYKTPDLYFN